MPIKKPDFSKILIMGMILTAQSVFGVVMCKVPIMGMIPLMVEVIWCSSSKVPIMGMILTQTFRVFR